jgi:hypothetical protein
MYATALEVLALLSHKRDLSPCLFNIIPRQDLIAYDKRLAQSRFRELRSFYATVPQTYDVFITNHVKVNNT